PDERVDGLLQGRRRAALTREDRGAQTVGLGDPLARPLVRNAERARDEVRLHEALKARSGRQRAQADRAERTLDALRGQRERLALELAARLEPIEQRLPALAPWAAVVDVRAERVRERRAAQPAAHEQPQPDEIEHAFLVHLVFSFHRACRTFSSTASSTSPRRSTTSPASTRLTRR